MEENTPNVEPTVEPTENVEPTKEPTVEEPKQPSKKEILRELSKEVGLNLFEPEGLEKLKNLVDSQKTEQEKLQERLSSYEEEKSTWEQQKLEYETKLKASELGIKKDYVKDALKLADNDPDKLEEVIKRFPIFKSSGDVTIGVQDPNNNSQPTGNTEVEEYLAKNYNKPEYQKYIKK